MRGAAVIRKYSRSLHWVPRKTRDAIRPTRIWRAREPVRASEGMMVRQSSSAFPGADQADLRAGSADLQNLYSQFELTKLWGSGESAAADGTHFETFKNNLLAARHFRYGKTGGIAYRHVSDNYIALFSRFIGCGIYEATYILDILQNTLSDLRPTRIYADSHGQSTHVFALAFLLGIELMPRIRGWKKLKLFQACPLCCACAH